MKKAGPRSATFRPSYKKIYTTAGIAIALYFILMLFGGGLINRSNQIGVDLLCCGMGLVFWLGFFAQFTLPLNKITDRIKAVERLLLYVIGQAGPVVRVENGVILERKDETSRTGPGVILLDTASGAVIRNPVAFVRAVGPGIAFTDSMESIAGVVDLHLQPKKLGPQENENPFLSQQPDESDASYKVRQERRFATQGLTRDGIEVCPQISVAVRLDADPPEGNSRFGFSTLAIEKAVKGRPIDISQPTENLSREVDITWLPVHLAADIWKECLGRFTLEELFAYQPGRTTALQAIMQEIRDRLTKPTYTEMDFFGNPSSRERESKEYKLLKDRGVKARGITLWHVKLPEKVEEMLVQVWKSSWMNRAVLEREYIEQQRSYEAEIGKRNALPLFARRVSHYLGGQGSHQRMRGEQILQQLIRGTLYLTNHESYLHRRSMDEIDQLKELLEWSEERPEG
jgi:hypothetical protein